MEKQTDEKKQSETSANCGSKSAVERLVSGLSPTMMGLTGRRHLLLAAAEAERLKVRGKTLATSVGHPEWGNVCLRCGGVEIPIDHTECGRCLADRILGR